MTAVAESSNKTFFGSLLIQCRESAKMTRREMAVRLGVEYRDILRWENTGNFKLDILQKYSKETGKKIVIH